MWKIRSFLSNSLVPFDDKKRWNPQALSFDTHSEWECVSSSQANNFNYDVISGKQRWRRTNNHLPFLHSQQTFGFSFSIWENMKDLHRMSENCWFRLEKFLVPQSTLHRTKSFINSDWVELDFHLQWYGTFRSALTTVAQIVCQNNPTRCVVYHRQGGSQ